MRELYRCKGCSEEKPREAYRTRKGRRGSDRSYRNGKCRSCEAQWARDNPQSRNYRKEWKERSRVTDPVAFHVKERISQWRSNSAKIGIPSDLTTEYVVDLWNDQGGLCYYTGAPMLLPQGVGRPMPGSASIDRKIPSLGYVQGNIVWSTYRANTSKGNLTEDEYYEYIENVLRLRDRRAE